MSDLAAALQVAIRTHADQRDKQGAPYLLHVLRVVEAVSDEAKVVAALHDVLEDGDVDVAATIVACELRTAESGALALLTRVSKETYAEYIAKIARPLADSASGRLAREIKLADLRDNLGRIPPRPCGPEPDDEVRAKGWDETWPSLKARYEKAIEILEA